MDYVLYSVIGLCMGVVGGTLGIGGAVFMIPAMTFVFGENQHLYQAASMICIFFVSSSSLIAHHKAKVISKQLMVRMVPAALVGILAGVAVSNSAIFEGANDYILSRVFGGFLVYVVAYSSFRFYRSIKMGQPQEAQTPEQNESKKTSLGWVVGLITGMGSGLLGMGAGTIATPLQQLLLRSPMKRAMSNSAMLIVCMSWLGAIYKNWTLSQHGLDFTDSIKIAACIIPGAIIGGTIGGHLMHALPKNIVRAIFILVCIIAAVKLLTVSPST